MCVCAVVISAPRNLSSAVLSAMFGRDSAPPSIIDTHCTCRYCSLSLSTAQVYTYIIAKMRNKLTCEQRLHDSVLPRAAPHPVLVIAHLAFSAAALQARASCRFDRFLMHFCRTAHLLLFFFLLVEDDDRCSLVRR